MEDNNSTLVRFVINIHPCETIQAASPRQTKPISRGHAPAFPPTSMNLTESLQNYKKAVLADFCGDYGTAETNHTLHVNKYKYIMRAGLVENIWVELYPHPSSNLKNK